MPTQKPKSPKPAKKTTPKAKNRSAEAAAILKKMEEKADNEGCAFC